LSRDVVESFTTAKVKILHQARLTCRRLCERLGTLVVFSLFRYLSSLRWKSFMLYFKYAGLHHLLARHDGRCGLNFGFGFMTWRTYEKIRVTCDRVIFRICYPMTWIFGPAVIRVRSSKRQNCGQGKMPKIM
jgi:hypothetical protein